MLFAEKRIVDPRLVVCQHEVDSDKVKRFKYLSGLPAPVIALYDDFFIPIDGHHRILAANQPIDVWAFNGQSVEDIDWDEARMMCGDTLAMNVAGNNN